MTQRGRRRLLVGLLLAFGGLIAALLIGPLLLDQERYRGILLSRAGQLLNGTITAGSLRVHLLPSPGVTIRDVRIADHAPGSAPLLEAERLNVALKLLPLLKGEIQVSNIRIDRPHIRLVRGPDGWNLADLIRPTTRGAGAEARRTEGARVARGQPSLSILAVGGLTIRDGVLLLEHPFPAHGPARLELQNISLNVSTPLPPNPLRITLSGQLPGKMSGAFELAGSLPLHEGDHPPIDMALHVRSLEAAQLVSALGLSHVPAGMFSGTLDLIGKAVGVWPTLELHAEADLQQVGMAATGETEPGKTPGDKAWLKAKGRWDGDTLDLSDMSLLWKGQTITGRLRARQSQEVGGLQVDGHVRSGALRWGKLLLTDAQGDLRYCCGQLTIRQLHGGFYGGTLSGDAALSFNGQAPRVRVTTHLEGIQTEPLLKAIQKPQWTVRGMMTLDSTMELSGPLGPGAFARVSGQTDMAVTNGRVTGYPPLEKLSKTADPILKSLGIPSLNLNEFDRLSAHWTLDGGILRTRDLTLLRDGAKFYAVGSANLLNQTLDFDVTAKVAKTTLEAKVQGPSSDPVVTPQAGSIEGRIKTEVGKLLGKDRQKELGKMLQQLFNR